MPRTVVLGRTALPAATNAAKFPITLGDRTQSDAWNDSKGAHRFPLGRQIALGPANPTRFPFKLGDRTQTDSWNDDKNAGRFPTRITQLERTVS
jgi:hypothetical protein